MATYEYFMNWLAEKDYQDLIPARSVSGRIFLVCFAMIHLERRKKKLKGVRANKYSNLQSACVAWRVARCVRRAKTIAAACLYLMQEGNLIYINWCGVRERCIKSEAVRQVMVCARWSFLAGSVFQEQ